MKYGFLVIITILIGACSGGSSSSDSQAKASNLIVSTENQEGEAFAVETLSYSAVSDFETDIDIECETSCVFWVFPDDLSGGINVTAQTILENPDPFCYEITYEGELYIDVDRATEQKFELVLYQLPYLCQ